MTGELRNSKPPSRVRTQDHTAFIFRFALNPIKQIAALETHSQILLTNSYFFGEPPQRVPVSWVVGAIRHRWHHESPLQ